MRHNTGNKSYFSELNSYKHLIITTTTQPYQFFLQTIRLTQKKSSHFILSDIITPQSTIV